MIELTVEVLRDIFAHCNYKEGWDRPETVEVQGIAHKFVFGKPALEERKNDIVALLNQLPKEFHEKQGGGYSFLNACMTNRGIQWGEQMDAEILMCLGIAIGKVDYCLPREFWSILPGSVPYFYVKED